MKFQFSSVQSLSRVRLFATPWIEISTMERTEILDLEDLPLNLGCEIFLIWYLLQFPICKELWFEMVSLPHTHTHTNVVMWANSFLHISSWSILKKIKSAFSFYYIYCHFHAIQYLHHRISICFVSWASLGGSWDKCPCFSDFSCKTAGSRISVLSSLKK